MIRGSMLIVAVTVFVVGFSVGMFVGEKIADQHGTTIVVREAQQ